MKRRLIRNFEMVTHAFRGTRGARRLHASHRTRPITAEAGVERISQRWPDLAKSCEQPIFIFAAGWRTGSTLLQRMLTANDLIIWGEPYSHTGMIDGLAGQLAAFNHEWPPEAFFLNDEPSGDWLANLYPPIQDFVNAHTAYLESLFALPARRLGKKHWGLKEVLCSVDHAIYLKWLFPKAKFIFLHRNPYDAWRSYRRWRRWYRAWPEHQVRTAAQFGRLWRTLTQDYIDRHAEVGGVVVGYENLTDPAVLERLSRYLDRRVVNARDLERVDGSFSSKPAPGVQRGYVPRLERVLLEREIGDLGRTLGYRS